MTKSHTKFEHIFITGASSGIGEALALFYADEGMILSLTGRNEERLKAIAQSCQQKGASVHTAIVDVTDQQALGDFLHECDAKQPIDLVIANAGISSGTGGSKTGEPVEQARLLFDINVTGVFNTIEPILANMIGRGKGQIALMSSLAGFRGWPGAPAYCASKAAVKTYGEGLRGALEQTGVGVNVICPGFVESRITAVNDFTMPFLMSAERAAQIIARGLEKNKGRICFPFRAFLFAWAFAVLPDFLAQIILRWTPAKSSET